MGKAVIMMRANGHAMKPGETPFEAMPERLAALVSRVFTKEMVAEIVLVATTVVLFGYLLLTLNHALRNVVLEGSLPGIQAPAFDVFPGSFGGFTSSGHRWYL